MKKIIPIICITLSSIIYSQNTNPAEPPFIEVTGTAMKEVVPDKIHIQIILSEKMIDRKTYTISEQENNLKSTLKSLNIDLSQLSLSDSNLSTIKYRRRDTSLKNRKEFVLIVSDSDKVSIVFNALNQININEASIKKLENSKIHDIRKEVRIAAIKAAKEKAIYLLEAINEEIGDPIEITELSNNGIPTVGYASQRSLGSNTIIISGDDDDKINFKTITVKFSYYIKYSIK